MKSITHYARKGISFDDIHQPDGLALDALDLVHLRTTCFVDLDPVQTLPDRAGGLGDYYRAEVDKVALQLGVLQQLERRIPVLNPPLAFRYHR